MWISNSTLFYSTKGRSTSRCFLFFGQDFACGFLQIPYHYGLPFGPADTFPSRSYSGLRVCGTVVAAALEA